MTKFLVFFHSRPTSCYFLKYLQFICAIGCCFSKLTWEHWDRIVLLTGLGAQFTVIHQWLATNLEPIKCLALIMLQSQFLGSHKKSLDYFSPPLTSVALPVKGKSKLLSWSQHQINLLYTTTLSQPLMWFKKQQQRNNSIWRFTQVRKCCSFSIESGRIVDHMELWLSLSSRPEFHCHSKPSQRTCCSKPKNRLLQDSVLKERSFCWLWIRPIDWNFWCGKVWTRGSSVLPSTLHPWSHTCSLSSRYFLPSTLLPPFLFWTQDSWGLLLNSVEWQTENDGWTG